MTISPASPCPKTGDDCAELRRIAERLAAAADARAAYNDCLRKASADCPVQPEKYSWSLGLTYKWDKPMLGPNWDERVFEQSAAQARIAISVGSTRHAIKVIASDGTRSAEATVHFTTR